MAMRSNLRSLLLLVSTLLVGSTTAGLAHDPTVEPKGAQIQPLAAPDGAVLFENVRIFDGKSSALSPASNVLVKGNIIERITTDPIDAAGAKSSLVAAGR